MVQVIRQAPTNKDESVNLGAWREQLTWHYSGQAVQKIDQALAYLKQHGDQLIPQTQLTAFQYGVETAAILTDFKADEQAIIAGLLFPLKAHQIVTTESLETQFGKSLVRLLTGIDKLATLDALLQHQAGQAPKAERINGVRKVLLSMVNDVRVVLVKLAERLCLARRIAKNIDQFQDLANSITAIYAPLASRLGMSEVKWEFEDLAFRAHEPKIYQQITQSLSEKRIDREKYIQDFMDHLRGALKDMGIEADIQGRVKHIYSIWRKMQKKDLGFEGLYDIRAVRILVNSVEECYQALGFLNEHWDHVPEEFDDYIASPKPNGYQSIHTVIIGPENKLIEVQMRTHKMHEENEMGFAAHWRYKEGGSDTSLDNKITWLRNLLSWQQSLSAEDHDLENVTEELVDERVYVFSPDNTVFDFSKGSTPLDFAYLIHTDVGHRCRGAKVNGKMVQLTYQLKTGDKIEILTQRESRPSRDWLSEHEGYLKTNKARAKVAQWFRAEGRDENIQAGRDLINKAARKLKLTEIDHEALQKINHKSSLDELYITLGIGEIKWPTLLNQLNELYGEAETTPDEDDKTAIDGLKKPATATVSSHAMSSSGSNGGSAPLVIGGVDNLMAHMAKCCKPVIGDDVIGYITQGKGVTVHRTGCQQAEVMRQRWPEKIIPVQWHEDSQGKQRAFAASLHITAARRDGLLRDVMGVFTTDKLPVLNINAQQNRTNRNLDYIAITIEIRGVAMLQQVINKLLQIPDVKTVSRD